MTGKWRMLTPPRHPILPTYFCLSLCCPARHFLFDFRTLITFYTLLTFLFCIVRFLGVYMAIQEVDVNPSSSCTNP
jgi:hypothetical protein